MLGPVEVFFAPHSFSILNSNGLVIWRDKEPGKVQLLNTENRTVLTVPLDEYIDDISSGLKDLSGSVKTGPTPVVMPDGRNCQSNDVYLSKYQAWIQGPSGVFAGLKGLTTDGAGLVSHIFC